MIVKVLVKPKEIVNEEWGGGGGLGYSAGEVIIPAVEEII